MAPKVLLVALLLLPRASAAIAPTDPARFAAMQRQELVPPSEQRVMAPAAVRSWSQILRLDLELSRARMLLGRTPPPDVPPDPLFEIEGPPSAPAPRARLSDSSATAGSCAGHPVEPPLSSSFGGLPDNATRIPPDTNGAVGLAHVMTMLNDRVRIRDRIGGVVSTVSLVSFWAAVGGTDVFDPKLLYESANGRWIATACADRQSASSRVLFAISAGGDPTGSWSFYSFDGDAADATWVDFPGFGFNSLWIAITMNMYSNATNAFQGVKLWAIDHATALAGGALTVSVFPTAFDMIPSGKGSTMQPCVTHDAAETTLYLLYNNFSSGGVALIRLSRLTGTGAAPAWSVVPGSTFSGGGFFLVANNFGRTLNDAPQLGDPRLIDTNDTRLLNAVVRNGSVWCAHSGELSGSTAAYWYEIDPTALPSPIVQSGFVSGGDGVHHSFPSIAVNCAGDACMGFSRSDASRYAEAVYVVRLAGDAPGTMGPVRLLKAGEDWYFKDFGSGRNRWGDYSSTVVDPVDDRAFWTLQEYARQHADPTDNGSRWGTMWGRIGSCGSPSITDQPDTLTLCEGSPASFAVSAAASNAPLAYQWRKDGVALAGETASTLSLGPALAADAGVYDVEVLDGCGSVLSAPAPLTVLTAVTISQQPASQPACAGQSVSLGVTATGANPLAYQWRKDGNPLSGENASLLTIDPVDLTDAGSYDVVVTGANGCAKTSTPATLSVLAGVTIMQHPASQEVCVDHAASLGVSAAGAAPLAYQWRRNGIPLPGETANVLTIDPVTPADAGTYAVVVTDADGCARASAPAALTVEYCKVRRRRL
jgi:hypothetical protein